MFHLFDVPLLSLMTIPLSLTNGNTFVSEIKNKYIIMISKIQNFISFLKKHKYIVTEIPLTCGNTMYKVTGNNIDGYFANQNTTTSSYIKEKFAFDNSECYDKVSKCPYILPIPENEAQLLYVLEKMKYIGSDEGLEKSNNYQLKQETKYN